MPDRRKTGQLTVPAPALLAAAPVAGCARPTPQAPTVDGLDPKGDPKKESPEAIRAEFLKVDGRSGRI